VKATTIARNYAEALFLAGEARGNAALDRYGRLIDAVAGAVHASERIAVALDSPRVAKATKAKLLADALAGIAPSEFVRFLQSVVSRGRQGLLTEIAQQYFLFLDVKRNRIHAGITLARDPDTNLEHLIVKRLSSVVGKEVRPHFHTDRAILGGVVLRVGDRIYDGSLRRRLAILRRRMLVGEQPL
jgi:F-type H+-transporting ATPase subunit delta